MTKRLDKPSQCVVSDRDFNIHWQNEHVYIVETLTIQTGPYDGPERRANAHDRRFYNGQGGRRRFDRKS